MTASALPRRDRRRRGLRPPGRRPRAPTPASGSLHLSAPLWSSPQQVRRPVRAGPASGSVSLTSRAHACRAGRGGEPVPGVPAGVAGRAPRRHPSSSCRPGGRPHPAPTRLGSTRAALPEVGWTGARVRASISASTAPKPETMGWSAGPARHLGPAAQGLVVGAHAGRHRTIGHVKVDQQALCRPSARLAPAQQRFHRVGALDRSARKPWSRCSSTWVNLAPGSGPPSPPARGQRRGRRRAGSGSGRPAR